MRFTHRTLWLLAAMLCVIPACKKTVEGESKRWERNLTQVQELKALYPGFSKALDEQQKKAQAAMEAAKAVGDAEQSAKAMAEANGLLGGGFVGSLAGMDSKLRVIREKMVKATTAAGDKTDRQAAKQVTDDAQRQIGSLDQTLKQGAENAVAASAIVRKVQADLEAIEKNLDHVISAATEKKEAVKADPAKADPAAPAPAAADWTCEYCQKANPAAAGKCGNCGADKP